MGAANGLTSYGSRPVQGSCLRIKGRTVEAVEHTSTSQYLSDFSMRCLILLTLFAAAAFALPVRPHFFLPAAFVKLITAAKVGEGISGGEVDALKREPFIRNKDYRRNLDGRL